MASFVGSPISHQQAKHMTDDQWLSAMAKYHAVNDKIRDGELIGGTEELAQMLEASVKAEPLRFARLALKMPDDANPLYFAAVLRGITGANLGVEEVLAVCRRCHSLSGRPCGHWICRPIMAMAEGDLPQEALDMVVWYATEDPDPEKELWKTCPQGGERPCYEGDPYQAGINSVRGSAAESVGDLIDGDPDRVRHLLPALNRMVLDPSIAVRSCVARALLAVLRHDRDLAVNLFVRLCNANGALLGTRCVEYFVYYAAVTHLRSVLPIIQQMLDSEIPAASTMGARQACVAALSQEEAVPLAQAVLSGTEAQRKGAAEVFATNLRFAEYRSFCESSLIRLFSDPSEEVRSEAAGFFGKFENGELAEYEDLVAAFINSQAFASEHGQLLHAMKESTARISELICIAGERFLDVAGSEIGDLSKRAAFDATIAAELVIRAYSQTDDEGIKARCLDLIDRMLQSGLRDTQEFIEAFER